MHGRIPDGLHQRRARQPHRQLIIELLADVMTGVQSALEHRHLQDVERAHQLPTASRQHARAGRTEFVDVYYARYALVVELDGLIGHVGRLRDRRRDNVHTRTGAPSLRYGWHEVTKDPCGIAMEVSEVLIAQGWTGRPARCPRCLGRAAVGA